MKKINFYLKANCLTCLLMVSLLTMRIESRPIKGASFENPKIDKSFQIDKSPKQIRKKKGKTGQKMNQTKLVSVPASTWGATDIRLAVEENAGTIEYACADGKIEEPLKVDEKGNFRANGVHIRQKGGPIREDSPPPRQPASYQGRISGDKMTLKVTLSETGEVIGNFTLERGKTPRIHRCY